MKKHSRSILALLALALCAPLAPALLAQEAAPAAQEAQLTEDQKIFYAMGLLMARQLSQFGLTEAELQYVDQGLADAVLGRSPKVDLETYGPKLQGFVQTRMAAMAAVEKGKADAFVQEAAGETGAMSTDSGLVYKEISAGDGASPAAGDTVKVHYHGKLRDGTVFDSSRDRGEPVEFALNQVIPCWTEGVQKMKVGGKSRLVCPADIAYGEQGRPGIPGGAALDFEVELLEIVALEAAPEDS